MKYFLVLFLAGIIGLEVAYQLANGDTLGNMMCTVSHPDFHALGDGYRQHIDNRR